MSATTDLARVAKRIRRVCAEYEALCITRDDLIRTALKEPGSSLRSIGAVCDLSHGAVALIRDSETIEGARV